MVVSVAVEPRIVAIFEETERVSVGVKSKSAKFTSKQSVSFPGKDETVSLLNLLP